MHFDLPTFINITGGAMGAAGVVVAARTGALKNVVEKLRLEVGELRDRLVLVENERDSHKRDADGLRERLIALLTENKLLTEKFDALKAALKRRAQLK